MNHVENIRIEEIVEIICEFVLIKKKICEFAKHGEKVVVDNEKLQLRKVVMKW